MELSTGWIVFVVYLMGQVDTFVSVVNGVTAILGVASTLALIFVPIALIGREVDVEKHIKALQE